MSETEPAQNAITLRPQFPPLVVMGVSGSGKSTIGILLAARLEVPFIDGDDLHPAANREKMATGIPLDDADRAPWLAEIGDRMQRELSAGTPLVVACSALKRRYRDALRSHVPDLVFVHLRGQTEIIAERLRQRSHEFMPATLLGSQLDALEPLEPDEAAILADVSLAPAEMVEHIVATLGVGPRVD